MIIWSGFGFLGVVIPVLVCTILQDTEIGLLISGVLLFLIFKNLHNPDENETYVRNENNDIYRIKKHNDTLYWIPLEYVGIIYIIISIVLLIQKFL